MARNGAHRWLKQPPVKENFILLAGRMVPEKGILECATAIAQVLPHHPEWALIIAGAKRFEESAPGSYEDKIATAIAPLKERAKMLGFIPIADMRDWQARAAISACPSLWHDPMPKAVLESLAAGCALITTRRGGIPEAAEGRALIIDARQALRILRMDLINYWAMRLSGKICNKSHGRIFPLPTPRWLRPQINYVFRR